MRIGISRGEQEGKRRDARRTWILYPLCGYIAWLRVDLFGREGEASVEDAKARLRELEGFVREKMGGDLDVVPISGKYTQNLQKVAVLMRRYVEEARQQ